MAHKKSIRFYNDREVRAVWDEQHSKWWFSAIDIIRAINDEEDYVKAGNYWRWLKRKLTGDGVQLVSVTHDFKFEAPDGKQRASDALDLMLRRSLKKCVDWSRIDKNAYLEAMRRSVVDPSPIKTLLSGALTDKINDRETFMKGIDYSYYYEQSE